MPSIFTWIIANQNLAYAGVFIFLAISLALTLLGHQLWVTADQDDVETHSAQARKPASIICYIIAAVSAVLALYCLDGVLATSFHATFIACIIIDVILILLIPIITRFTHN